MSHVLKRFKTFKPREGVRYKYDYVKIYNDILSGKYALHDVVRGLVLDDLFFIVYFLMWNTGNYSANDPKGFVVGKCREVENDIKEYELDKVFNFLDMWAREHFKSAIITKAMTIQNVCKHPEKSTCIFSFRKKNAEKFQDSIRDVFVKRPIMSQAFPNVMWADTGESTCWSSERGLLFKREGTRQEKTIESHGLIEGMPTGMHYDYIIFDDIETEDMADNPEQLDKAWKRLNVARNLGVSEQEDGEKEHGAMKGSMFRIVGTPYSHLGALVNARDLKIDDEPFYSFRLQPVMDENKVPYLVSYRKLKELQASDYFNSQQMCDPTPEESAAFTGAHLIDIAQDDMPDNLVKYQLVDWAGDMREKASKDAWAIMVVGVDPNVDDLGASDIYITDLTLMPMEEEQAIREVVSMYLNNGMIQALCIEEVNNRFLTTHVADILRRLHNVDLSREYGNLIPLKPRGRNKARRIRTALGWSFRNGKIKISTAIPIAFRDRLRNEMNKFPVWHDDGLDALSYIRDIMDETGFKYRIDYNDKDNKVIHLLTQHGASQNTWMSN